MRRRLATPEPISPDFAQVVGARRSVVVEAADHVGKVAVEKMLQARVQHRPAFAGQREFRMHPLAAPALGALAEQPRIGALAEGPAPAVAHQPRAHPIVDRDEMDRGGRGPDRAADLRCKRRRDMLVGIDLENPVAGAGIDAGVAARAFQLPGALDSRSLCAARSRGSRRCIDRAPPHFVGERELVQAVRQPRFFVMRRRPARTGVMPSSPDGPRSTRRGRQIVGHEIGAGPPFPARSRRHSRCAPESVRAPIARPSSMSTRLVADDEGLAGVEAEFGGGPHHHPRQRLAAIARLSGPCGQKIVPSSATFSAASRARLACTASTLRHRDLAARDAGLVGHHRQAEALGLQLPERIGDARIEFEQLRIGQIVFFDIDGAVAVEKDIAPGRRGAASGHWRRSHALPIAPRRIRPSRPARQAGTASCAARRRR